jgi:hypothetical protein
LSEPPDFLFVKRRIRRCSEHTQDLPAPRARGKVAIPMHNFVLLERLLEVSRNQLGVGTFLCVAMHELVQGFAHPPCQRFFSTAIA